MAMEEMKMASAVYGFFGALLGAVAGFVGAVVTAFGKSRDTAKDVLTRTVTNERAQWRKDLRELVGEFVENTLRLCAKDPDGCIYSLDKQRVLIRLRLNPNEGHDLDEKIMRGIEGIVGEVKVQNAERAVALLGELEGNVQRLLKAEWDKSKREAETGNLEVRGAGG